jgi:hypothetical protein
MGIMGSLRVSNFSRFWVTRSPFAAARKAAAHQQMLWTIKNVQLTTAEPALSLDSTATRPFPS